MHDLHEYDFEKLYKNEGNAESRIRLLGLYHYKSGKTFVEVGSLLLKDRHTIAEWVARFQTEGLEGVYNKPGRGRNPILAKEQEDGFVKEVELMQKNRQGGRVTGEEIKAMLLDKFDAEYSLNGVYELLERVGLVWITSRSEHPKADQSAQEHFKKTLKR